MHYIFEDYTYDYIDQNGRFLLISKESGLEIADVDALQKNMIYANTINRLLTMEVEERDFAVKLRYTVGPRRTLRNVLRSRKMSRAEFYQVLLDIINTLQASRDYMLNARNYLLISDYIFVGNDLSDLNFVYLPLKDIQGKKHLREEFEQMILELSQATEGMMQQEQAMLLKFCKDQEQFSPGNLRRIIIAALGKEERQPEPVLHVPAREPAGPVATFNELAAAAPVASAASKPNSPPPSAVELSAPTEKGALSDRIRVITFCVAALALALVWKFYLGHPEEGFLYIGIGASVLIGDAVYVVLKVRPWSKSPQPLVDQEDKSKAATSIPYQAVPVQRPLEQPEPLPLKPVQAAVTGFQAAAHQEYQSEKAYYDSLPERTSIFTPPSNETALLNLNAVLKQPAPNNVWLEVERNGSLECLPIKGNSFVVGRKESAVDYIEAGSGVSRVHMEILKTADGWVVRDLDSKNGTFINNEKLIPNKNYDLNNGDRVKIATVEYTFRIE